jgi:hypothetical protein
MDDLRLEYRIRAKLKAGLPFTLTGLTRDLNVGSVVQYTITEVQTVLNRLVSLGLVLTEKKNVFYPERFKSGSSGFISTTQVRLVDRLDVTVYFSTEIEQGVDP